MGARGGSRSWVELLVTALMFAPLDATAGDPMPAHRGRRTRAPLTPSGLASPGATATLIPRRASRAGKTRGRPVAPRRWGALGEL